MMDLYKKPGHLIRRVQQIAVAVFMEQCAEFEVTPVQYAALVAIRENDRIDATRLSALVAFDRSTIGNVLERLEDKGLIERFPIAEDKRVKRLKLSARGAKLLKEIEPSVLKTQELILAPLKEGEKAQFMNMLERIAQMNNHLSRAPLSVEAV